jgi:TolB-like protein/DNA-binding winged helix-turn-helix (wHTH) protein
MNASVESPATPALEQGFQLGELRIDSKAGEAAGPAGREKLDPKVIDVLVMLAQNAREVVLREDLLARLWPNVVVSDEVLSRCIYELRKQLSLAGGSARYKDMIETVPKRGYRLNADIAPIQAQAEVRPAHRSSRWLFAAAIVIGAAVVLAIVASQRLSKPPAAPQPAATRTDSIAVLPFVDMSEGKNQGYLADGISEEILNRLAQSNKLRVIARTSSFSLRDPSLNVADIARKLDVSHVLEGSVRRSGDHIRITAQLISASNSSHLWSNTFDRELGDLFAIQDDIAASVATALRVTLGGATPKSRMPARIEAYESFLRGEFFYYRRAPGDVERAVTYYEEAVSADPRYARAWAALSGAYRFLAWEGVDVDKELLRLQGEAARRAVELDSSLAVAHVRLAQFYGETGEVPDWKKADEHERIAMALDPNEPMLLAGLSDSAFDEGDIDRAIAISRRIVARDPLNRVSRQNFAVMLLADLRLDEAMSEYRSVLELSPDAGPDVEIELVRIFVLQGRDAEAYAAAHELPEGKYRDHGLALLYRAPGYQREADAALARLAAQRGDVTEGLTIDIMDDIRLAEVQVFRGLHKEAFQTLTGKRNALARKWGKDSPILAYLHQELKMSPFLKRLHADPRWSAL